MLLRLTEILAKKTTLQNNALFKEINMLSGGNVNLLNAICYNVGIFCIRIKGKRFRIRNRGKTAPSKSLN